MAITEYEDKIKSIVENVARNGSGSGRGEFIYDFLEVYDKISKATITKLRKGSNNLSKVPGEVYLKNKLYFKEVPDQVLQGYSDLEDKIAELKSKPRYTIVTDYKQLLAKDEKTGDTLDIKFKELPQYFDFFLAWDEIEKADFEKENPADLKAAERFAKLYDEIAKDNKDIDRHGLNLFLIRLLFCLFAEDTKIFEADAFTNYLKQMTATDGSDMNERLGELFSFLDKKNRDQNDPSYLKKFPYVNGQLFTEPSIKLHFSKRTRELMIDAGELIGWAKVNPDILGSMLQAVATEDTRSHLGMHYTSVPNIMKVIKPLFLDGLREEFDKAKGNEKKLTELYDRIGKIKFMDPACGSGNFLIITYKELRQLEIDIIKELNNIGVATMYIPSVTLDQFYGIEIEDFACDVTRLSLWIAEHQMNVKLHEEIQDAVRPTLPLQKAGAVVCGNALRLDWEDVLPHGKDDEVYLFGNPPYLGASGQNKAQKEDMAFVFSTVKGYKKLDFISAWFYKGMEYCKNTGAKYAFVTTNSICQGEQVKILWTPILKHMQIIFAYQSFKWSNNAKNNAGVTVVIIGMACRRKIIEKKIYSTNNYIEHVKTISPYLIEIEDEKIIVKNTKVALNGLPIMSKGSSPTDGGYLLMSSNEGQEILAKYTDMDHILKKYVGSKEFIDGFYRYTLWITDDEINTWKNNEFISNRLEQVKKYRSSKTGTAKRLADKPWKYVSQGRFSEYLSNKDGTGVNIIIPRVSSENRFYVPMGVVDSNTVISDSAMAIYDAPIWLLGLLESRMHMTWLRAVGGRLKTDYRYSAGLVYNTFPVPELSTRRKNEIEELTLNILDIRDEEGGTLAELYGSPLAEKNPKPMNPRLLKAHQELDEVVDRAYKATGFKDDNERLSLLLDMYSKKVQEKDE